MHLFIVEGQAVAPELQAKFGPAHSYDFCPATAPDLLTRLGAADVAFDLREWPELHYEQPRQPLFYDTSAQSLAQLFHGEAPPFGPVFGFSALPTLLNRPNLEVACYRAPDAAELAILCQQLGTAFRLVPDRVGLFTPRLLCLSINEVCWALQEGVASAATLDALSGPEEGRGLLTWANQIGPSRVYKVLEALYQDTHEARYRPCPLLKTLHLRGEQFTLSA